MKKFVLISLIIFLFTLSSVYASGLGFFEIAKYEEVDGFIGIHIVKKVSATVYTNSTRYNTSVIRYTVDGESVGIRNGSATQLITDSSRLVILDKPWPTSGYYNLSIVFTESTGTQYPPDTFKIFSTKGMEKVSSRIDVDKVLVNKPFNFTIVVKNNGDADVKNIKQEKYTLPRYFLILSKELPSSLKPGDTAEIVYNFDNSRISMDDSIIYTTTNFILNLSYTYYGETQIFNINESIVVYNPNKVSYLPVVNVSVDVPYGLRNSTINISIYPINTNIGSHSACNLNFTIIENISGVEIPTHTILPGETLAPSGSYSLEPMVRFKANIDKNAPLGNHNILLKTHYKDCDWSAPQDILKNITLKVVDEIPEDDTGTGDIITNESEEELPKIDTKIEVELPKPVEPPKQQVTINESSEELEKGRGFYFYLSIGALVAVVIFLIVYMLMMRSTFV